VTHSTTGLGLSNSLIYVTYKEGFWGRINALQDCYGRFGFTYSPRLRGIGKSLRETTNLVEITREILVLAEFPVAQPGLRAPLVQLGLK
jgi:hypothetical protein